MKVSIFNLLSTFSSSIGEQSSYNINSKLSRISFSKNFISSLERCNRMAGVFNRMIELFESIGASNMVSELVILFSTLFLLMKTRTDSTHFELI